MLAVGNILRVVLFTKEEDSAVLEIKLKLSVLIESLSVSEKTNWYI